MAARRLQTEIDRILKRVREGVYEFDAVRDKLHHAASNAQKDKMEGDLKSVIKKLQRLRDQIKAWLQSSEVKDKSQLLEYRSLIETQMETFKAVEKEMKIKAFSKEGLSAVVKKDPAEEAKEESNKWLSVQVKQLARQIETTEADIEQLSASTKKGRKVSVVAKEGQVTTLKSRNVARKWHIGRLELLKRIVENGTVTPDCVETIKEDVEYFVDNNTEEELALADYDYIYDDFNLDEEEEAFGLRDTSDMNSSHDTISTVPPDDNGQNSKRRESVDESKVLVSLKDGKWAVTRKDHLKDKEKDKKPSTAKPAIIKAAEKDNTVVPPANFAKLVARAAALSPTRLNAEDIAPMSPIRYAAAAAAAVAAPATLFASVESESGSLANSSVTGPSPTMARRSSAGSAIQIRRPPFLLPSPASSHEPAFSSAASIIRAPAPAPAPVLATAADSTSVPATTGSTITSSLSVESFPFAVTSTAAATPTPATLTPTTLTVEQYPSTLTSKEGFSSVTRAPPPLAPLITNFDHDRLRQIPLLEAGSVENMDQISSALQISVQAVSDAHDNGKWRYYVPKMPYPTPAYYPQEPLPIFDSPTLYHKLDPDTLFFIFYYQQGTCHQYFAARELKRQSWRFHKQYLTWFQRHTEPIEITNEYELGTYTYFDWEGSWLKRKRSDFRFEYRWLED